MGYEITRGRKAKALKVLIYGCEGVGKTCLAASFPDPLFIDCEGGSDTYDVARFPRPLSWEQLLQEVQQVIDNPECCRTLVIDTIDWAEAKAIEAVCAKFKIAGIEDLGWGKGYIYLNEQMGKLLNKLSEVIECGVNVVLNAHMAIRTVSLPDDSGSYDRYELKLKTAKNGNNCQLVKEWCDMILFCNFKQFVVEDSKNKKTKVTGGYERKMYTEHTAVFDAKNRFGLAPELPMDFNAIAHLFASKEEKQVLDTFGAENVTVVADPVPMPQPQELADPVPQPVVTPESLWVPVAYTPEEEAEMAKYNPKLVALMKADSVHENEIQKVVGLKKYFPETMPIADYPADFVEGWLLQWWPNVMEKIREDRELPF